MSQASGLCLEASVRPLWVPVAGKDYLRDYALDPEAGAERPESKSQAMIRRATIEDQSRITAVRSAVRENRLSPENVLRVSDTARWIYANGTFWVWEEDGVVQGFAVADVRDGTIFGLFVHPDYEGRGIARALLPLACEDLRIAGHTVARLTTDPGTRAERFYRLNGWIDTGRREKGEIVFERALHGG